MRQFWATLAGTPERAREERIAQDRGLELFELKSQVEALGVAFTERDARCPRVEVKP